MSNERFELRVGFFTLFALILLLYGWGWLKSFSPFDPPTVFWVRFHDIAGLSNNATVNIQGVRVGTVDQISFKPPEGLQEEPEANPEDANLPRVYTRIRITGTKIPLSKDIAVTIQTLGMVGAKYIEITLPRESEKHSDALVDPMVVLRGNDPVRVEMIVNNVAKKFNQAADAVSSEEAASALKDFAQAASKLNKTMDRMPEVTTSIKRASDNFGDKVAGNANRFFDQGTDSFRSVGDLAQDLNRTNHKIDKLLDNPAFSADLRETVNLAHKTAESVSATMKELSETVKDKELRQDLLSMLSKLQGSSNDIRNSVQTVDKLAADGQLRADVKDLIRDAKEAMNKANEMFDDPTFRTDVKQTLARVKNAAINVDTAAIQLKQILGKRAPLFHMMFGKPGTVSEKQLEELQDGATVNNNSVPH
ncbi:MAG: MlaD family protein [Candidatus Obscuribacterales bacterium]|jgi:ABC-type transporter Mla subunit MlaD|nr:MlaD family protein [Candidatus Obscuribacterales bacterium]